MKTSLRNAIDNIAEIARELIVSTKGFDNSKLEDAIEASGIDVKYFVDEELDGFLKWDGKQQCPIIAVNANQPLTRQNFSMAHELGHLIIDWHWLPYGDNDMSKFDEKKVLNVTLYRGSEYSPKEKREETTVNEFAAAFLMPDSYLEKLTSDVSRGKLTYSSALYRLKDRFDVSMMSASYRLKNYCDTKGLNLVNE